MEKFQSVPPEKQSRIKSNKSAKKLSTRKRKAYKKNIVSDEIRIHPKTCFGMDSIISASFCPEGCDDNAERGSELRP